MGVRRATVADAEGIAQVLVDGWRAAYRGIVSDAVLDGLSVASRARNWRRYIADGVPVWVFDSAASIVGVACVRLDVTPAELAALYVAPPRWRSGVGRALLRAALASLGERDVVLWVFEGNTRAIAFYSACGFALDGGRSDDGRAGAPEVRMVRASVRGPLGDVE